MRRRARARPAIVANQVAFNPGTDFDHLAVGDTEMVTLSYYDQRRARRDLELDRDVTVTGTNDGPVANVRRRLRGMRTRR